MGVVKSLNYTCMQTVQWLLYSTPHRLLTVILPQYHGDTIVKHNTTVPQQKGIEKDISRPHVEKVSNCHNAIMSHQKGVKMGVCEGLGSAEPSQ